MKPGLHSPGRLAYERDVIARPLYQDGTRRRSWGELGNLEKWSWEKNPTPRATIATVEGRANG